MSNLNVSGIYKITNIINNKFYIGKSVNINNRWRQHKLAKDSSPLHQAMLKYGKDNFIIEIIEVCQPEELNEKEIYWIKQYNAYFDDKSYNATLGGDGASHPVKLSHADLLEIIGLLKNTNLTIKDIAEKYSVSTKTISDINNGNSRILLDLQYPIRENKYDGQHSIKKEKNKIQYTKTNKEIQPYHSYIVQQFNKDTHELLAEFSSVREAARNIGCNPNSILKALKSKTHISYGYIWLKKE